VAIIGGRFWAKHAKLGNGLLLLLLSSSSSLLLLLVLLLLLLLLLLLDSSLPFSYTPEESDEGDETPSFL
jgi:hypothetical protein